MAYSTSWQKYIDITVTNNNANKRLTNCQLPIRISGAPFSSLTANGNADGSDYRVTYNDADIPFVLGNIGASDLWITPKYTGTIAPSGQVALRLYYNNPSATSVSSLANTFGSSSSPSSPVDLYNQSNHSGFNANPLQVVLQHQTGPNASKNGQIVAVILAGVTGGNTGNDGSIAMVTSTNGGVSWSAPTALLSPAAGSSAYSRSLTEMADGTLALIYSYDSNAKSSTGTANYFCATSSDGGTTWANLSTSPTNRIPAPWTYGTDPAGWYACLFQDPATGHLYSVAHAFITGNVGSSIYLFKCSSGSDPKVGTNWTNAAIVDNDGTHKWSETWVHPVTASSWVSISRNDTSSGGANDGDLYIAKSSDGGVTWGTYARMNIPGTVNSGTQAVSPFVMTLQDGNHVLAYGMRMGTTYGCGLAVVTDNFTGTTWHDRPIATPLATAISGYSALDFGYPTIVQLADGTLVMADYYQNASGVTANTNCHSTRFAPDWVYNQGLLAEDCQSLAAWTALGNTSTDITPSTAQKMTGKANSIKFDDSTGTHNPVGTRVWTTNPAVACRNLHVIAWMYTTQVTTNGNTLKVNDTTPAARITTAIFPTPYHWQWYNGAAYTDPGAGSAITLNAWQRLDLKINVTGTSSATGSMTVHGGTPYTGLGQSANGNNPASITLQAGSVTTTNNSTFYLGSLAVGPDWGTDPTFSFGTEQSNSAPSGGAGAGATPLMMGL